MGFNLNDYEQVDARIQRFYKDHPDGRILTELVSGVDAIERVAVVKASAYVGDKLVATGLAFELVTASGVNQDAHLENCETSAIGRALANMGYQTHQRPSREEMEKVERAQLSRQREAQPNTAANEIDNMQKPPPPAPPAQTGADYAAKPKGAAPKAGTISVPQGKRLYAIAKSSGWEDKDIHAALKARFKVESSRDIMREQYEEVCAFFQKGPWPGMEA